MATPVTPAGKRILSALSGIQVILFLALYAELLCVMTSETLGHNAIDATLIYLATGLSFIAYLLAIWAKAMLTSSFKTSKK